MSLFNIVWAKAGTSNKRIAKDVTYLLRFIVRLISLVACCRSHARQSQRTSKHLPGLARQDREAKYPAVYRTIL